MDDTVNLAARLQQICTDGRIFISAATQQRVVGRVITHPIGELKVKGRVETVPTFEVLALE